MLLEITVKQKCSEYQCFLYLTTKQSAKPGIKKSCTGTLLALPQLVLQDLEVFFCKADLQTVGPQPVPMSEVTPVGPFLQPV